jgi:competence protein ComGC
LINIEYRLFKIYEGIIMMKRKGMSQALTIVVAAVVLIVVSLVIITIVTGGLGNFASSQNQQIDGTGKQIASASDVAYCNAQCAVGNCDAKYNDNTDNCKDLDGANICVSNCKNN